MRRTTCVRAFFLASDTAHLLCFGAVCSVCWPCVGHTSVTAHTKRAREGLSKARDRAGPSMHEAGRELLWLKCRFTNGLSAGCTARSITQDVAHSTFFCPHKVAKCFELLLHYCRRAVCHHLILALPAQHTPARPVSDLCLAAGTRRERSGELVCARTSCGRTSS